MSNSTHDAKTKEEPRTLALDIPNWPFYLMIALMVAWCIFYFLVLLHSCAGTPSPAEITPEQSETVHIEAAPDARCES